MAVDAAKRAILRLREAALRARDADTTDAELLKLYLLAREDDAFEALVRRHGPMVLSVCRRVLRNDADAEDAFQATFLVFVRKAASIRSRSAVGSWLYGVAFHTALKAKAMNQRRRIKELDAGTQPKHQADEEIVRALHEQLDKELNALPEKYRIPVLLCDLEGKTIKDAARQVGWPAGTMATRLTRGRAALARRLRCQGLTLSAGVLAAALSAQAALGNVPASLVVKTVHAAGVSASGAAAAGIISAKVLALSEGVVKAMFISKLASVAIAGLIVVAALGIGGRWFVEATAAQEPAAATIGFVRPAADEPAQKLDDDPVKLKREIARLQAELERTRLELQLVRQEAAVAKAQAELARAQADVERLRAKDDAKKSSAPTDPSSPGKGNFIRPPSLKVSPAISPDEHRIAIAQGDTMTVKDLATGKIMYTCKHGDAILSLAFASDGKILVSSAKDKSLQLWDVSTGKLTLKLTMMDAATEVKFSPDSRNIVATWDNGTQLQLDAMTGTIISQSTPQKK
jgi:RNA polymerase sigma factor (sigma-70 family)